MQAQNHINNQTGCGPGCGDGGCGGGGCNVGTVKTQQQDNNANNSSNPGGHSHAQGGQNGHGFSHGTYGGNQSGQSNQDFNRAAIASSGMLTGDSIAHGFM